MGVVYKAEDTKLGRTVALKFLAAHLLQDEESRARFIREAKAAAALDHPNICTVHEIDEADGHTFIAMAFIEGETVQQKIEAGPLKIDESLDIAIQVARGLAAAHNKGIVHRDIKSANVMIAAASPGADPQAKLLDFGLALLVTGSRLTEEGTTLGLKKKRQLQGKTQRGWAEAGTGARSDIEPNNGEKSEAIEDSQGAAPGPQNCLRGAKIAETLTFSVKYCSSGSGEALPESPNQQKENDLCSTYILNRRPVSLPGKMRISAPKQPETRSSCTIRRRKAPQNCNLQEPLGTNTLVCPSRRRRLANVRSQTLALPSI